MPGIFITAANGQPVAQAGLADSATVIINPVVK